MTDTRAVFCVAAVILLLGCTVSAQQWTAYDAAFTATYLTQEDLTGWTVAGNIPGNVITTCGSVSIVGGFNAFGT
jgi:outer membrane biogenesis lipoprotein LolB